MTKELAKELQKPFVPKSTAAADINTLLFYRTTQSEVLRCCQGTRHFDVQSGYYWSYCGMVAEYVASGKGGRVALCEQHAPPNHLLAEPAFRF